MPGYLSWTTCVISVLKTVRGTVDTVDTSSADFQDGTISNCEKSLAGA